MKSTYQANAPRRFDPKYTLIADELNILGLTCSQNIERLPSALKRGDNEAQRLMQDIYNSAHIIQEVIAQILLQSGLLAEKPVSKEVWIGYFRKRTKQLKKWADEPQMTRFVADHFMPIVNSLKTIAEMSDMLEGTFNSLD